MNITKQEICNRLAKKLKNSALDIKPVMDIFFDEILTVLSEGHRIEIRGFGAFNIKKRRPRKGRNPRTGAIVDIAGYIAPFFKFSKEAQNQFDLKIKQKR